MKAKFLIISIICIFFFAFFLRKFYFIHAHSPSQLWASILYAIHRHHRYCWEEFCLFRLKKLRFFCYCIKYILFKCNFDNFGISYMAEPKFFNYFYCSKSVPCTPKQVHRQCHGILYIIGFYNPYRFLTFRNNFFFFACRKGIQDF